MGTAHGQLHIAITHRRVVVSENERVAQRRDPRMGGDPVGVRPPPSRSPRPDLAGSRMIRGDSGHALRPVIRQYVAEPDPGGKVRPVAAFLRSSLLYCQLSRSGAAQAAPRLDAGRRMRLSATGRRMGASRRFAGSTPPARSPSWGSLAPSRDERAMSRLIGPAQIAASKTFGPPAAAQLGPAPVQSSFLALARVELVGDRWMTSCGACRLRVPMTRARSATTPHGAGTTLVGL